jgi:hypothetical protein
MCHVRRLKMSRNNRLGVLEQVVPMDVIYRGIVRFAEAGVVSR